MLSRGAAGLAASGRAKGEGRGSWRSKFCWRAPASTWAKAAFESPPAAIKREIMAKDSLLNRKRVIWGILIKIFIFNLPLYWIAAILFDFLSP
jgi:hypothetical protein